MDASINGSKKLSVLTGIGLQTQHKAQPFAVPLESELPFRALIEHCFDCISLRDKQGRILYHSPSCQKVTGYTADEVKGMFLADLIHPEDRLDFLKRQDKCVRNPGVPVYGVHRSRHKTGNYIWVEGTITNLLNDENIRAIVSNFRDITERKLAEETAARNDKRFRALIENNFDGISMLDRNGNIIYVSPAAERMLGYSWE